MNAIGDMSEHARDWTPAAYCHTAPRTGARFSDLPRAHKFEIVRLAFAAAAAVAWTYYVASAPQPLPSRVVIDATLPQPLVVASSLPRSRAVLLPRIQPRTSANAATAQSKRADPPPQPRRGNLFTRFLRSLAR